LSGSVSVGGAGGGGAVGAETSFVGANTLPFPVGGQSSQCGMVDECCGMMNEGCCPLGGQTESQGEQCSTTYERKCRYANKPFCQTQSRQECAQHPIKDCRQVQERRTVNVPVTDCRLSNERKCFNYTGKECKSVGKSHQQNITWVNQELSQEGAKELDKCVSVRTCDMQETMETISRKVPKRQCEKVPQPRRVCNTVAVPQPPQTIQTMDYRTEYRQQCYQVPKPVCKQVPCQYSVVSQNICPTCVSPLGVGGTCGTPSCAQNGVSVGLAPVLPAPLPAPVPGAHGGVDICNNCRMQNVQQCTAPKQSCEMTTEQVCQQVPIRVPVPGSRTVPSPPKYEMKCDTTTDFVEKCRTVWVDNPTQVPRKSCKSGVKQHCFKMSVPSNTVVTETESEIVNFPTRECDIVDVEKQHCANLPTKMTCNQRTVPNTVVITRQVCDQTRVTRQCYNIPYSTCVNSPGQECWMEPREVCKPVSTCSQSNYCNQCSQFASTGGFSQCSTSTCPNYVSAPPVVQPCSTGSCPPAYGK